MISAALLAVGMSATAFAADINVTVEGTPVSWTDAKPFVNKDSRTMVPLRPIANALGLNVDWNAEYQTAHFSKGDQRATFIIDEKLCHYVWEGEIISFNMDTAPCVINGRTYAPAKYLAEAFDYKTGWDQATKSVTITKEFPIELDLSIAPATAAEVKTPQEAMALVMTKMENNIYLGFGDPPYYIEGSIQKIADSLFAGTPYKLTADLCRFTFVNDELGAECRLTVTNTETKETFRMIHVNIPLQFYPE